MFQEHITLSFCLLGDGVQLRSHFAQGLYSCRDSFWAQFQTDILYLVFLQIIHNLLMKSQ